MLEQRAAVVTGGGSGIGRSVALQLAAKGTAVAVIDVREHAAAAVAKEITNAGAHGLAITCDVSLPEDCASAVGRASETFGRIDVLCNAAGIASNGSVEDVSVEEWDRVFAVNVRSCFLMSKYVVPIMREQGGGAIISISSVEAHASVPCTAAYTASKGAIEALSRQMALDFAKDGIRVLTVAPAGVDTPLLRADPLVSADPEAALAAIGGMVPVGRVGSAEEVAKVVVFLASKEASYMTGSTVLVDGGALAQLLPPALVQGVGQAREGHT